MAKTSVQIEFSSEFRRLGEITLAKLITFNCRRFREVSKLTLDTSTSSHAQQSEASYSEVEDCLSPIEKQLYHLFTGKEQLHPGAADC